MCAALKYDVIEKGKGGHEVGEHLYALGRTA